MAPQDSLVFRRRRRKNLLAMATSLLARCSNDRNYVTLKVPKKEVEGRIRRLVYIEGVPISRHVFLAIEDGRFSEQIRFFTL